MASVLLPEVPGIIAVGPMMGTAMMSSQPAAGRSTRAEPNSRQPLLPTGVYTSVYS
jgi:hypothetical protein